MTFAIPGEQPARERVDLTPAQVAELDQIAAGLRDNADRSLDPVDAAREEVFEALGTSHAAPFLEKQTDANRIYLHEPVTPDSKYLDAMTEKASNHALPSQEVVFKNDRAARERIVAVTKFLEVCQQQYLNQHNGGQGS